MAKLLVAFFNDSQLAGDVVGKLKASNFSNDITVVSKKSDGEKVNTFTNETTADPAHGVKAGASSGATAGAVVGGLAAAIVGLATASLPGGIIVAGPLAMAAMGVATGAVTGGMVGWLTDKGIPDQTAKMYESQIVAGQTLVTVNVNQNNIEEARSILTSYGAKVDEVGDY